jgi:hypothetical protein
MKKILFLVLFFTSVFLYNCARDGSGEIDLLTNASSKPIGNLSIVMEYGKCDSIICFGESYMVYTGEINTTPTNTFFSTLFQYMPIGGKMYLCERIYLDYNTIIPSYCILDGETYSLQGGGKIDLELFYEVCYEIEHGGQ